MNINEEYEPVILERLEWILAVMINEHPAPERLEKCQPGVFIRPLDDGRLEAFLLDADDNEVLIGRFPAGILLRRDVTHPISQN